jgi:hypothetical protein
MASHPSRRYFSYSPPWKPQTLHSYFLYGIPLQCHAQTIFRAERGSQPLWVKFITSSAAWERLQPARLFFVACLLTGTVHEYGLSTCAGKSQRAMCCFSKRLSRWNCPQPHSPCLRKCSAGGTVPDLTLHVFVSAQQVGLSQTSLSMSSYGYPRCELREVRSPDTFAPWRTLEAWQFPYKDVGVADSILSARAGWEELRSESPEWSASLTSSFTGTMKGERMRKWRGKHKLERSNQKRGGGQIYHNSFKTNERK